MKIALIAGGTRGIGLALVQELARAWQDRGRVYLTARQPSAGSAAVAELRGAAGINVDWLPFDLSSPDSATTLARTLHQRHGGVDFAVLNGAYVPRPGVPAAVDARPMIEANNHGTLRFLRAFAPILRSNARMVIVASAMGVLASLPEPLREKFNTRRHSPGEINAALDEYVRLAEAGTAAAAGWPDWVNIPSKVGQVAVTRSFARRHHPRANPGILINAACPGLTVTDATRDYLDTVFRGREAQTPEQAAKGLLWLLDLPSGAEAPDGELVRNGQVLSFGD